MLTAELPFDLAMIAASYFARELGLPTARAGAG
jgi:hypothetical protein